jgi:diaminohydroxyphosphoribosylaminopyrimidine deaminase/5-amino-6-(5-phosphoribosylamino)uracil reductase
LAEKGFGHVSPNPMVGCLIVHNGEIIGSGYHKTYGGPHAEVNAINSVKDTNLIKDSTAYVSLEPCSHFGKTPPCADLLIQSGIKKVVIGSLDPNPLVAGQGMEKLKQAGIEVKHGILENECKKLNKRFFSFINKKRPFIILKWAESADGFMGSEDTKQISGLAAQKRLHKWRSEEDAFLVGTNTLIQDNPQLNTRLWKGKNPIRVAIDFDLKSENKHLKFYDQSQRTIILNGFKNEISNGIEFIQIPERKVETIVDTLYQCEISCVVVEGGSELLKSFIAANLYDEIRILKSKNLILNHGIAAPKIDFVASSSEDLMDDYLTLYE